MCDWDSTAHKLRHFVDWWSYVLYEQLGHSFVWNQCSTDLALSLSWCLLDASPTLSRSLKAMLVHWEFYVHLMPGKNISCRHLNQCSAWLPLCSFLRIFLTCIQAKIVCCQTGWSSNFVSCCISLLMLPASTHVLCSASVVNIFYVHRFKTQQSEVDEIFSCHQQEFRRHSHVGTVSNSARFCMYSNKQLN